MYCLYTSYVILDSDWKLHYVFDRSLSLFPLFDMIKIEKRPIGIFWKRACATFDPVLNVFCTKTST